MREEKNAEELLDLVEGRIAHYLQELKEGRSIDLKGFEERVHTACETLTSLPVNQARYFEARLKSISALLAELSKGLGEQYAAIKHELQNLEAKQKAQNAYAKAGNIVKPEEKK